MKELHTIETVKWANQDKSTIFATIDGREMFVPDDINNRHRAMIEAWVEDGNEIGAFQ